MLNENVRIFLGIFATFIAIISYIPYVRDIFLGKTNPHSFSWLIWGILMTVGFAAQLNDNGGPGAWVIGFSAIISFLIFGLSLKYGEKNISKLDWVCLISAVAAIPLWIITSTPIWSVILITVIDFLGFVPTWNKSIVNPDGETLSLYVVATIKHSIGIAALASVTLVTLLYPLSLVITNAALAILILNRRSAMS